MAENVVKPFSTTKSQEEDDGIQEVSEDLESSRNKESPYQLKGRKLISIYSESDTSTDDKNEILRPKRTKKPRPDSKDEKESSPCPLTSSGASNSLFSSDNFTLADSMKNEAIGNGGRAKNRRVNGESGIWSIHEQGMSFFLVC